MLKLIINNNILIITIIFVINILTIMNLDFILFSPPKIKYSFVDLWGEVIFIPKTKRK